MTEVVCWFNDMNSDSRLILRWQCLFITVKILRLIRAPSTPWSSTCKMSSHSYKIVELMNILEDFYGHKEYYGYALCHVPISKNECSYIMLMFLIPSFSEENISCEPDACASLVSQCCHKNRAGFDRVQNTYALWNLFWAPSLPKKTKKPQMFIVCFLSTVWWFKSFSTNAEKMLPHSIL